MRANGGGTVHQRKDGRWEAVGCVLAPGNIRKRVRAYGTTRKEALAELTEEIATSNCGVPVPPALGSPAAYLTYWRGNRRRSPAAHHLPALHPRPRQRPRPASLLRRGEVLLWPLTLAYVPSVLKSAPEHAVREE